MNNNILLFGLLIFVAFYLYSNKKENFVEIFSSAGHKKPSTSPEINYDSGFDDSDFSLVSTSITPDEIEKCTASLINFVKSQSGLCVFPLETNDVHIYENNRNEKLYKFKMMLMVRNVGFPFGFMISASVFMDNVLSASTQTIQITSDIDPYSEVTDDNFLSASELLPKPNISK